MHVSARTQKVVALLACAAPIVAAILVAMSASHGG
jgi:hypothetical protein